jgi:hypothetical protein
VSAQREDLDEGSSDPTGGSRDGNPLAFVFGLHRSSYLSAGGSPPAEINPSLEDTRRHDDVTDGRQRIGGAGDERAPRSRAGLQRLPSRHRDPT